MSLLLLNDLLKFNNERDCLLANSIEVAEEAVDHERARGITKRPQHMSCLAWPNIAALFGRASLHIGGADEED